MGADRFDFFYRSSFTNYWGVDGLFDMLFNGLANKKILSFCFVGFRDCLDYRERDCSFGPESVDSFLIYIGLWFSQRHIGTGSILKIPE